jgi:tRNA-specific 2-thiouridylase
MAGSVLVAMSGGVDSSHCAAILLEQGWHVEGVYMRLWGGSRRGSSCSTADHSAAQAAADHLGVALHTVDWTADFERQVIAPFVASAAEGEIGNPCISCNRQFKIQGLVSVADRLDIRWIASGHYAQVVHEGHLPGLYRAADHHKDQSYVMWALTPPVLERLLLPNGHLHKEEIRRRATTMGLPAAATPDSMDLCFDPKQAVKTALGSRPGRMVDSGGNHLGDIEDVGMVAIGQRRGLGLPPHPEGPRYVLRVEPQARRVVIGSAADLMTTQIRMTDWTPTQAPTGDLGLFLQTSAHGHPLPGRLHVEDNTAVFSLDGRTPRPTPGQFGVVYEGDRVIGAGVMRGSHELAQ